MTSKNKTFAFLAGKKLSHLPDHFNAQYKTPTGDGCMGTIMRGAHHLLRDPRVI